MECVSPAGAPLLLAQQARDAIRQALGDAAEGLRAVRGRAADLDAQRCERVGSRTGGVGTQ